MIGPVDFEVLIFDCKYHCGWYFMCIRNTFAMFVTTRGSIGELYEYVQ